MPKGVYIRSLEGNANISKSKSGVNHPFFGKKRLEHSIRMMGKNNPNSGGTWHGTRPEEMSQETKDKISEARIEWYKTHDHPNLGIEMSQEQKDKISESKKGISWGQHSEKTKQLMSIMQIGEDNSFYNKHHSQKTKDILSELNSGENSSRWIDGYSNQRIASINRGLGFYTLNERTDIATEMHHIDNKFVVFIPARLHESVKHSVKSGKNMKKMNRLAFAWLESNGIELQRSLLSFGDK